MQILGTAGCGGAALSLTLTPTNRSMARKSQVEALKEQVASLKEVRRLKQPLARRLLTSLVPRSQANAKLRRKANRVRCRALGRDN